MYNDSCSQYPATLTTAAANGCAAGTTFGTYMNPLPTDPQTAAAYQYSAGAAPYSSYCLGAVLEGTNYRTTAACTVGTANYTVKP